MLANFGSYTGDPTLCEVLMFGIEIQGCDCVVGVGFVWIVRFVKGCLKVSYSLTILENQSKMG